MLSCCGKHPVELWENYNQSCFLRLFFSVSVGLEDHSSMRPLISAASSWARTPEKMGRKSRRGIFARVVCWYVYLFLVPLVWCVSRGKCKYTCTNKLSWDARTPTIDLHVRAYINTQIFERPHVCDRARARWWGRVCDGGQQWPQTLNREASVPLHPSDTHKRTRRSTRTPLRPVRQRRICYVSRTHLSIRGSRPSSAAEPNEVVRIVRDNKDGRPGCCVTASSSFRLSLH